MNPFEQWQILSLLLPASALVVYLARELTWPVSLFLGYMIASWALHGYQYHGLEHIAYFSAALVIAYSVKHFGLNPAFFLSYLGLFLAIFGLCEWAGWNIWSYQNAWELNKPTGFFGQETHMGAFLAACLAPALFDRRWWCAVPIALCVVATHSSFSVLSGLIVILAYLVQEDVFSLGVVSAAVTLGVIIFGYECQDSSWIDEHFRSTFWQLGWAKFLEAPIFGIGPGGWLQTNTIIWANARVSWLHNEWLEMLVEYGIAGAAIVAWGLRDFFKSFRLTWTHAVCVALMVDAIGNFPFHVAPLGVLFLSALVMCKEERCLIRIC